MNVLRSIPLSYFESDIHLVQLLTVLLIWLPIIALSLWYYNTISNTNTSKKKLDNPIYQSKDILLQEYNFNDQYIPVKKVTSFWIKLIIFILSIIVILTPLYKLLNTGYFL